RFADIPWSSVTGWWRRPRKGVGSRRLSEAQAGWGLAPLEPRVLLSASLLEPLVGPMVDQAIVKAYSVAPLPIIPGRFSGHGDDFRSNGHAAPPDRLPIPPVYDLLAGSDDKDLSPSALAAI